MNSNTLYQERLTNIAMLVRERRKIPKSNTIALVSCGKMKLNRTAAAKDLYSSALFKSSLGFSNYVSSKSFILSAKYGLVDPTREVDPYDLSLNSLSKAEKDRWAKNVCADLQEQINPNTKILLFAGRAYTDGIVANMEVPVGQLVDPMAGLGLGFRMAWLKRANRAVMRDHYIRRLYENVERLQSEDKVFPFSDLSTRNIPPRGLYIFFDPRELSIYSKTVPRIVRIGTHAISANSKSMLRTRMRQHLGTKAGTGNHRGSVFRLHVGESMMMAGEYPKLLATWGKGSNAELEIRQQEEALELHVSQYLRNLLVTTIDIDDEPSKDSQRARLERALINLLTEDEIILDSASDKWVGAFSERKLIRLSGLWNVRDVGGEFNRGDFKIFEENIAK